MEMLPEVVIVPIAPGVGAQPSANHKFPFASDVIDEGWLVPEGS